MFVVDAESLTLNNLAYREPSLYDELLAGDILAADLASVIARHNPSAQTVLDLGCGTARLLAELHDHGLSCTGIDLQPHLVRWAQHAHPGVQVEIGDVRTSRLGTTFDVVTCVGNTLSYLHTDAELTAAFDTIRAHSHPGTVVALATLTGTGRDTRSTNEITTSLGAATVTTTSAWDPTTAIHTTIRTWQFTNGRVEHDTMHRRFWSHDALAELAHARGFDVVPGPPTSLTLSAVHRQQTAVRPLVGA